MRSAIPFLSCLTLLGMQSLSAAAVSVRAVDLRCEYRKNPLGIDESQPRLSWRLEALNPDARGIRQSAYQILAGTSEKTVASGRGDLWDTGKVASDQSWQVSYAGKPLSSTARVYWRVRTWVQNGEPSAWSDTAIWSMGLVRPDDWKAKWIGKDDKGDSQDPSRPWVILQSASWLEPDPIAAKGEAFYRFAFDVPSGRKIVDATIVIGGDTGGELYLNGNRVGRVAKYGIPSVLEIASSLNNGRNVVAVHTSRGTARPTPGMIAGIRIAFSYGDPMLISTSAKWKASSKPTPGWQQADFSDQQWAAAKVLAHYGDAPWGAIGYNEERRLAARMLRKEFQASRNIARATVYFSGLGTSELYLNGTKVEDAVLSPGLTQYEKRVFYVTYDVTKQVRSGANAIGVWLGNGRYWAPRAQDPARTVTYGAPRLLLQMEVEYADGRKQQIVSDESWKLTDKGPIRANNEFDGEEYDARMELAR